MNIYMQIVCESPPTTTECILRQFLNILSNAEFVSEVYVHTWA